MKLWVALRSTEGTPEGRKNASPLPLPAVLVVMIAVGNTAACPSAGPQSPPNCQVPYAIGSPAAGWPPVSPSAFRSPCRLACLIPGQPRARLGEPASHVLVNQAHLRHLYRKLGARRHGSAGPCPTARATDLAGC